MRHPFTAAGAEVKRFCFRAEPVFFFLGCCGSSVACEINFGNSRGNFLHLCCCELSAGLLSSAYTSSPSKRQQLECVPVYIHGGLAMSAYRKVGIRSKVWLAFRGRLPSRMPPSPWSTVGDTR